jgi:two-component system sensor histidine kinase BaeS
MLRTLRSRLILSHILPLLLVVPLLGIALVYVLETQMLLVDLSTGLQQQALLAAEIAADRVDLWTDPFQAQALVSHLESRLGAHVMLLDAGGCLLASSDSTYADRVGQLFEHPDLGAVLAGATSVRTTYSFDLHQEIVEALVPVVVSDQRTVGIVRMSHRLTGVFERFMRLRYLIAGVMVVGLLLGAAVGWALAVSLARPIQQVTTAVGQLAVRERTVPLLEQGPQEMRLLKRSVNTLMERLQMVEQSRLQLLANVVHELRRPLGALRSAIQALLRGAGEDAALRQELLQGMEAETRRLQRLLDDMVGLSDHMTGALELERRPTEMREWLLHALGPWREAVREKRVHWETVIPDALPALPVDPDRLGQALGNLLSNAIKYTPAGGTVSVSAGLGDKELWIRVSDTGPGISPDEQARIFTPLYRSQPGRRFPQGMGLGLTIARELVIAHGGRLEMESSVGLGSHFTIWLPLNP